MLNYAWLLFKRFALLFPGIVVAYFSARNVYPYIHQRLPFAAAVLTTYVIGAYILVPAIMRTWRIFSPTEHLPLYSVTPDGHASDPLNIGLFGSHEQLVYAMENAGWHIAEAVTVRSAFATVKALALNRPYDGMPMTRLYLFGRKQDIGFEKQIANKGRGHRHHVRFWATTLADIQDIKMLRAKRLSTDTQAIVDDQLWAGAASLDNGIALMRQSLQLAHAVHPDTNAERDLIVKELEEKHLAKSIGLARLHPPYKLLNRTWFAFLHTDGKMVLLRLGTNNRGRYDHHPSSRA